ncbi:MAG: ATP synthase F0 subunit B [Desulfobacterales bacterium]
MILSGLDRKRFAVPALSLSFLLLALSGEAFAANITVIPNWTTFIQAANFIILVFILNMILYRPIRNILIKRKEKMEGLEQTVENATTDLVDKENTYASGIREARKKGLQEKDMLVNAATEEEKAIIDKINADALAELNAIKAKVAQEAESAREALLKDVDTFANEIGVKILGRAV